MISLGGTLGHKLNLSFDIRDNDFIYTTVIIQLPKFLQAFK